MPLAIATTSKSAARGELVRRVQERLASTSDGAGTSTTLVDSTMAGWGDDYFNDWWVVITSGTHIRRWRKISDYTSSSGTFTWLTALSSGSGSGVTYELHKYSPEWYTEALRNACLRAFPQVHRRVTGFWFPGTNSLSDSSWNLRNIAMPSGMEKAFRVRYDTGREVVHEDFAASALGAWTSAQTFAHTSGRLYSSTNTNGDILVRSSDPKVYDGHIRCTLFGIFNHATVINTPDLLFHANSTTEFLGVKLLNGTVYLFSNTTTGLAAGDATLASGTLTTADSTDYVVDIRFIKERIEVWVDGVQYIDHLLAGANWKFLDYGNAGMRLTKGDSSNTARWDSYRLHEVGQYMERGDWVQNSYHINFVDTMGANYFPQTHMFTIDGGAPLTLPALDTTVGLLDSADATAVLEIDVDDPGWPQFMKVAEGCLYEIAGKMGNTTNAADREQYRADANTAFNAASRMQPQAGRASGRRGPVWG